jgi:hypothetical protein
VPAPYGLIFDGNLRKQHLKLPRGAMDGDSRLVGPGGAGDPRRAEKDPITTPTAQGLPSVPIQIYRLA